MIYSYFTAFFTGALTAGAVAVILLGVCAVFRMYRYISDIHEKLCEKGD